MSTTSDVVECNLTKSTRSKVVEAVNTFNITSVMNDNSKQEKKSVRFTH